MESLHTLAQHVGLVLVESIIHFTLQLLSCLTDVLLNLLSLLLLHLIQRLPALGVLKLKRTSVGEAGRLLTFSEDIT